MPKRMTAVEVVAELWRRANQSATKAQDAENLQTDSARIYGVACDAYMAAAYLVKLHLTPHVLDEPDGPGDYHVEGVTAVCRVVRSSRTSQWMYYDGFGWEPLAGRRVAKVPPGPFATSPKSPEPAD